MKNFKSQLPKHVRVIQNLFLPTSRGRIQIYPHEIIYLEANVNYTVFHTLSSKIVTSFHLKFFSEALQQEDSFLRISRSCILNLDYLKEVNWSKSSKAVCLKDGTILSISRRRAREIKSVLLKSRVSLQNNCPPDLHVVD